MRKEVKRGSQSREYTLDRIRNKVIQQRFDRDQLELNELNLVLELENNV